MAPDLRHHPARDTSKKRGKMSKFKGFLCSISRMNIPWYSVLRGATSVNFWLSLAGMAILIAFLWCFDLIDDSRHRIAIAGLYAVVPVLVLAQAVTSAEFKRYRVDWGLLGLVLFLLASLLIAIGGRIDSAPLVLNVSALTMAGPLAVASWLLARKQPLIAVAAIPSVVTMVFLGVLVLSPSLRVEFPLLPLPYVLLLVAPWVFVASRLLTDAQRFRQHAIRGPTMEARLRCWSCSYRS